MKCMCAQTRPRFILSPERVFGGMEFEPMLTPREKSPLPENFPRGGSKPARLWTASPSTTNELFRPQAHFNLGNLDSDACTLVNVYDRSHGIYLEVQLPQVDKVWTNRHVST